MKKNNILHNAALKETKFTYYFLSYKINEDGTETLVNDDNDVLEMGKHLLTGMAKAGYLNDGAEYDVNVTVNDNKYHYAIETISPKMLKELMNGSKINSAKLIKTN